MHRKFSREETVTNIYVPEARLAGRVAGVELRAGHFHIYVGGAYFPTRGGQRGTATGPTATSSRTS